jgi:hypothetical protein
LQLFSHHPALTIQPQGFVHNAILVEVLWAQGPNTVDNMTDAVLSQNCPVAGNCFS